jgi:hypothetical protein
VQLHLQGPAGLKELCFHKCCSMYGPRCTLITANWRFCEDDEGKLCLEQFQNGSWDPVHCWGNGGSTGTSSSDSDSDHHHHTSSSDSDSDP